MCIPSFNILAIIVPEKTVTQINLTELRSNVITELRTERTPTQILNVNMLYRERKKNGWKKKKIKSHDPESQSYDTIIHSTYEYHIWRFLLAQFRRKLWHKFSHKRQKNGQIKGRMRARSPILNPTIQQVIVYVYTKFQHSNFRSSWENSDTNF